MQASRAPVSPYFAHQDDGDVVTAPDQPRDPLAGLPRDAETIQRLDRQHVFPAWAGATRPDPLAVASAAGSYFTDYSGNQYLDFSSQMVNANIGHQHPRLLAAIGDYMGRLTMVQPTFANDARSEAARVIAELAGSRFRNVLFTTSGAEANENAIRMARLHTGRSKILSSYHSYHGNSHGVIGATGDRRRWGTEPYTTPGHVHFWGPYFYRSHFHSRTEEEECERALSHLRSTIAVEGPRHIAAVLLEPVVGANGILVPPPGYLEGVQALCRSHGILLIADEVMSGFGRCGEWFAVQRWGVEPDLITFAKGVNSGYIPLGGVIVSEDVAETFDEITFPGGSTYRGHPLACASAVASIAILEDEHIVEHARSLGEDLIGPELERMASQHRCIGDVRGLGVFWAIELIDPRGAGGPFADARRPAGGLPMGVFTVACKERGIWPRTHANRVHVLPPCTASHAEVSEGLAAVDEALTLVDAMCSD